MNYKHFLLVESEKKAIREMYGLLTEQYFKSPNGGTAQIINKYPAGYYSLSGTDKSGTQYNNTEKLTPIITNAIDFLTKNKGYIPRVVINAGESIIPNYDTEGGTGVKSTGWLSQKRKDKIQQYVKEQFADLVSKKLISKDPEVFLYFDEAKTLTIPSGGWDDYKKWNRSTDAEKASNPKNVEYSKLKTGYQNDQFTKINFKIVPDLGPNQCSFDVKIGVHYDDLTIGHKCNAARFQILANGVPLTTGDGTTCGAGLSYADMNNGGGSLDCKKNGDIAGRRMNYFKLNSKTLVDKIMAASPDKNSIKISMKCTSTGFDDAAGRCHQDVPHITIHNTDGKQTVNTYPKVNDKELITIDKCGNLISGGGGVATKSKDAGGATTATTTKPVGIKLNFASPSTGTLTSDQAILNKISDGSIKKNTDNTYSVIKAFVYNGVTYRAGDTIDKVLPKGSTVTDPRRGSTTTTTTIKTK